MPMARERAAVRRPPLFPWRAGFCVWCDLAIPKRLKKNGESHRIQASWHKACADEYNRCAHPGMFQRDLVERDGRRCRSCGATTLLVVDHVVPLWKVVDLEPSKRREYFRIGNLQLLCERPCHERKTTAEAAERAHFRRLAGTAAQIGATVDPVTGEITGRDGVTTALPPLLDLQGRSLL